MPPTLRALITTNDVVAAAFLNSESKVRFGAKNKQILETVELLRATARRESNPFYRFWFAEIADAAEEKYRQFEADIGGGSPFGSIFVRLFGADTKEDDECDCEDCRARRAGKNSQPNSKPKPKNKPQGQDRQQELPF